IEGAEVASVQRAIAERAGARRGIPEIAGEQCLGPMRAQYDLAALARPVGLPPLPVPQLHREPRHRPTHDTDGARVVIGRDARGFRHAIAFPDLDAETLLERAPDLGGTASAPRDPYAVAAVEWDRRLLQKNLQDAAEVMDMRRARISRLLPEAAGAE